MPHKQHLWPYAFGKAAGQLCDRNLSLAAVAEAEPDLELLRWHEAEQRRVRVPYLLNRQQRVFAIASTW